MSNAMSSHPEPERLLQFADDELEGALRQSVSAHLETCEECRGRLNELESGESEYAHTWMPALRRASTPPPAPWFDLRARMAEMDALSSRNVRVLPLRPRWLAAAAAVVAVFVAARWFTGERVSAAELLHTAAAREGDASRPRLPIRLTTRAGIVVRPAVWRTEKGTRPEPLRALFESANYSWEDPLSARSFSRWRQGLAQRQDRVIKLRSADGTSAYEVRTRTEKGTLTEARLRLRASDFHAFYETLHFRNDELVEIAEVTDAAVPPPAPAVPRPPAATQPPSAAEPVEEPITPGEELRVWLALRRIDADLGEPIQVEPDPSANALVVTVMIADPARRRAIHEALSALARVRVQFSDPQPVRAPSRNFTAPEAAAKAPPLRAKLEAQLGSRSLAEDFVNRALEESESVLLRAHALRKLAERFPPARESQLTPADKAVLASLLAQHFSALSAAANAVAAVREVAPSAGAAPVTPAADWQAHTANLLAAAEQADKVLTRLLAVPGAETDEQAELRELDAALGRLEAEISAAAPLFGGTR